MRHELADHEWFAIKPMLPNKPRGVPRVNDRRVLNGIFWVLRSGAPWRDLPDMFGPYTTCYNRFVRWRRAGVWGRIIDALAAANDPGVQMIDTSIVRVHQHGACITRNQRQSMGRSRGGLTSKIHAVVDGNGLPVRWRRAPARPTMSDLPENCCLGVWSRSVGESAILIPLSGRGYGPGTSRQRHDHVRHPSCNTAIEGSAQRTRGPVRAEPEDRRKMAATELPP